jgi:hypothetical protein
MVDATKATGKMESSMAVENTSFQMELLRLECGRRERESNGLTNRCQATALMKITFDLRQCIIINEYYDESL